MSSMLQRACPLQVLMELHPSADIGLDPFLRIVQKSFNMSPPQESLRPNVLRLRFTYSPLGASSFLDERPARAFLLATTRTF